MSRIGRNDTGRSGFAIRDDNGSDGTVVDNPTARGLLIKYDRIIERILSEMFLVVIADLTTWPQLMLIVVLI